MPTASSLFDVDAREEKSKVTLRNIRTEMWVEQNGQAIEDYNTRIATQGLQGMKYQRFGYGHLTEK